MPASLIFRHAPPPLLPLFARAFRRRPKVDPDTLTLPALEARLLGTASVTPALANYRSLCGFPGGSQLPATWPHILAFPLHLRLLTDTTFPLPLLGLVHLRNRIVQHRAIAEGEALDIRVYLDNWVRSHRGIEFDLVTDVMVAGRTVWQETSTNLYRQAKPEATESRGQTQPGDLPRYPNSLEVRADAALGRPLRCRVRGSKPHPPASGHGPAVWISPGHCPWYVESGALPGAVAAAAGVARRPFRGGVPVQETTAAAGNGATELENGHVRVGVSAVEPARRCAPPERAHRLALGFR